MSKGLIYLVAIFALWMYLSFSKEPEQEKPTIKDFDNAGSGHGGNMVSAHGPDRWTVDSVNSSDSYNTTGLLKDQKGYYWMKDGTKIYVPMT